MNKNNNSYSILMLAILKEVIKKVRHCIKLVIKLDVFAHNPQFLLFKYETAECFAQLLHLLLTRTARKCKCFLNNSGRQ